MSASQYVTCFQLCGHIYASAFNKDIVILDLKKNKYTIVDGDVKEYFPVIINSEFTFINNNYIPLKEDINIERLNKTINKLRDLNILMSDDYKLPRKKNFSNKNSQGIGDFVWRMNPDILKKKVPFRYIFRAYFSLCYINFVLHIFGFYSLIKIIKKKSLQKKFGENITQEQVDITISALSKATLYFPINTKCLEWAAALTYLLLNQRIKCQLQIGIQTIPFLAHAWVVYQGEILADNQTYLDQLAIILTEPFNNNE